MKRSNQVRIQYKNLTIRQARAADAKQLAALGREELVYGMQVWVEPISPDEALRQELRGWHRVKHHAIENEAGNRFILDSCGAKWLAYPAKPE